MSQTKVEHIDITATIKLTQQEAEIIRDLLGAMSDLVIADLLAGKKHSTSTAVGLTNEIYMDLDRGLEIYCSNED
jgi:hypothetical protein